MAGLSQNVLICTYYVIIDIAEKIRECQIFLHGFFSISSRIELYFLYIRSITYINLLLCRRYAHNLKDVQASGCRSQALGKCLLTFPARSAFL